MAVRSRLAFFNASSMSVSGGFFTSSVSTRARTSLPSAMATLRRLLLNSSASIFILDMAFGFAGLGDDDVAVMRGERAGPAVDPFDDSDAFGREVRLQTGGQNLLIVFQPMKIEVMQRQFAFAAFVFTDKRERGRSDWFADAEAAGNAFDELGFARAEVAFEADDPAGFSLGGPRFAEGVRFFRTVGDDRSHEARECAHLYHRAG